MEEFGYAFYSLSNILHQVSRYTSNNNEAIKLDTGKDEHFKNSNKTEPVLTETTVSSHLQHLMMHIPRQLLHMQYVYSD